MKVKYKKQSELMSTLTLLIEPLINYSNSMTDKIGNHKQFTIQIISYKNKIYNIVKRLHLAKNDASVT